MTPTNPEESSPAAELSDDSRVSTEELRYHFEGLRSLFVLALIGLIAMTVMVDLCFIRRQMVYVRMQLDEQQPKVSERVAGYRKSEPLARNFLASLQSFTNANTDFQPIFERCRPYLYNLMTAGPVGATPAPKVPGAPAK